MQQHEEVRRTVADWAEHFAPEDLLHTQRNAELLTDYCINILGVVTAGSLSQAYNALRDKLDLVPPPPAVKPKTAEQLAQEEILRQHADYMRSIAPQESFEAKVARDKQKRQAAEAKKKRADAKGQLEVAISGYQCYRTNGSGVDYTATQMVQHQLRSIRFGDAISTLAAVKAVILEIDDHPTLDSVARAIECVNARLKN